MVKRGDKYHMKGFALAATFAQVEVFWWLFERRRTFTRSCACPSKRGFITLPADGRSWRRFFYCMCTRVVTNYVLSARRASSHVDVRDMSTEIDAHITGLTGTRLPVNRPWDGRTKVWCCSTWTGLRSEVEVRTETLLEHVCRRVHSCEQEILEAEALGKNIRCASSCRKEEPGPSGSEIGDMTSPRS